MRKEIRKRIGCWLLILAMAITLIGCVSGGGEVTEPSGTGGTAAPTKEVLQNPSEDEGSKATEPNEATAPTSEPNSTEATTGKSTEPTAESSSSGNTGSNNPTDPPATQPQPTEPKPTDPQPTDPLPTEPKPTEPKPTDPQPTEPKPTEPKPTDPQPTDPQPTEPKPTEPKPTDPLPTEPVHTHDYSYQTNLVLPSCTEPGYTVHKCSCGDSYRDEETPALGYHNWSAWYITTQPTTQAEGQMERRCMTCGIKETDTVPKLDREWDGIDTAELERYGRQYAAETYGYDPVIGIRAGYYPGWTGKLTTMADGFLRVAGNIDATTRNLMASGGIDGARLDVEVVDEGDGYYTIWVYYG